MRIKKLELKNFRGFEDLTIDFPEGESGLAVFVGVNGSGKTSVLEGIIDFINNFCLEITRPERGKEVLLSEDAPVISGDDVRHGCKEAEIFISFEYLKEKLGIYWKIYAEGGRGRMRSAVAADLEEKTIEKIRQKLSSTLWYGAPIIAYYSSERFVQKQDLKPINLEKTKPWHIYNDSLNNSINFRVFFNWFRSMEDVESEQIRFTENAKFRSIELETVRNAVTMFLPNFSNLRVKRQPKEEFIVDKNGHQISLSKLSHGEKMTIAMIGDIAKKLSSINPNNPLNGHGVVLIDEIEQHLHPGWQRTIIPNLRRTFPNIQFILTTHSPQVLSNVPRENVFVLEDFKLVKHTPHTFGRDSNSILWDLFGVRERPEEAQKDFSKLSRLLNDPKKEVEAKELLTKLSGKYGEDDSEVVRARLHLEFLTES